MFVTFLDKILNSEDLSRTEAKLSFNEIMQGRVDDILLSSFLTGLKLKGETIEEITGFAESMRENALKVELPDEYDYIDTCGTGGDGKKTINISTGAALVAACAGARVAKHGNRSVSSSCGSADVLEEMGIDINMGHEAIKESIVNKGFGFLFAPVYHKSMKYALPVRKRLRTRTVFNILGPLSNPANVSIQMIGVFSKALVVPLAEVLRNLGIKRAMVFYSLDGSDELSVASDSYIAEIKDSEITTGIFYPPKYMKGSVSGLDAKYNADILMNIFSGKITDARFEVVVLNAACAIYLYGISKSIEEGTKIAKDVINKGLVLKKIEELRGI